ncbi:C2 domain-containing protein [Zychaea mexicana]|uniref:C2 domain-containing protein n=1 Tax=Zychaea mexicana TaxID=64656 RepID=UPI0022FEAD2E|nr:C2 domain-containing protein [Zychaea mexicana]KAI9496936.1 C2 domain-containing protein [Zychaea mexicana]
MEEQLKKTIGELVVIAIKARDLPNREVVGKQDPFVTFRLGETAKRTKTDYRGGQHPIWDDQVNLPVPEGKTTLYMQVFDEDGSREDLISEGDIDLKNVLQEGEEDKWYPLKYRGKKAGEIYVELTFYSARPPPKRQPTRLYNKRPAGAAYNKSRPVYAPPQQQQQQQQYLNRPPPVPTESASTPARMTAGPPIYRPPPPRPMYNAPHDATPHMPQTLTPSSSTGTASSAGGGGSAYTTRPPGSGHHHSSSLGGNGGYPPVSAGYPPSQPMGYGGAPLLSSSYRPAPSPAFNAPPSGPAPMGFRPPAPYPPHSQPGAYPPPQPTPSMSFPTPQPYTAEYTPHHDQHSGQPFAAAHQAPYPPAGPPGGYPPPAAGGGYPPQQGYPPYPAH